jgi:hypothetical protein
MPYAFEKKTSNVLLKSNGNFLISFKTSDRVAVQGDEIIISAKINAYEDADSFRILFSEIDKAGSTPVIVGTTAQQIGTFLETNFFPDASTGGGGGGSVADGSITTPKLADDAVTFAKTQNINSQRFLARVTVGAGNIEEIDTAAALALLGLNSSVLYDANGQVILKRSTQAASAGVISLDASSGNVIFVSSSAAVNTIEVMDANTTAKSSILILVPQNVFTITNADNIALKNATQITTAAYEAIMFVWDFNLLKWIQITYVGSQFKQTQSPIYGSDFQEATALNGLITGGSGATFTYTDREAGRLGILSINRGTTAINRGRVGLGTSAGNVDFFAIGGKYGFQISSEIKIPVLSNGTDRFLSALWLNSANDGTDGANVLGFKIQDNINAGKVQVLARKNSVNTAVIDTGVTVLADTWLELVIKINAAGNLAEFFINGTEVAEVTVTGNIPQGTAQSMGVQLGLYGVLGTTDRALKADNLFLTTI